MTSGENDDAMDPDSPAEDEAPPRPIGVGAAGFGMAQVAVSQEAENPLVEGAIARRSHTRGMGRRITLVREAGGMYAIYMGSRRVAAFCNEWEEVTNFQLPEGIEQQVSINIEVLGQARAERKRADTVGTDVDRPHPQETQEGLLLRAREAHEARRMEHRGPTVQNPSRAEVARMFSELPPDVQDMISGMITESHQAEHGVALQSVAHPYQDAVVGELRDSLAGMMNILERLG